jgi:hypothetical protein
MAKRPKLAPRLGQQTLRHDPQWHNHLIGLAKTLGTDTAELIRQMVAYAEPEFRLRADRVLAERRAKGLSELVSGASFYRAMIEGGVRDLAEPGEINPGTLSFYKRLFPQIRPGVMPILNALPADHPYRGEDWLGKLDAVPRVLDTLPEPPPHPDGSPLWMKPPADRHEPSPAPSMPAKRRGRPRKSNKQPPPG